MFGLLSAFSMFLTGKEIIKEAMEKPAPKGTRFDWDAYYKDIENGMSTMEQIKKRQRGGYMTTKPIETDNLLVDMERYEKDKRLYGEEWAEKLKKAGHYKVKKTFYKY